MVYNSVRTHQPHVAVPLPRRPALTVFGTSTQRHVHPLWRRVYDRLRPLFGGVVGKTQKAYFVTLNGHRYKRLVLGDAWQAARIERELEQFEPGESFPPLILRHENELLLGYVEGRRFDGSDAADRERLARFYAMLYRRSSRQLATAELPLAARLERDLQFLVDVGTLDAADLPALRARAEALQPERVWLGFDYVDPVEKNFVCTGTGVTAVDVESLVSNEALGAGIAKARVHWLGEAQTGAFLENMAAAGAPDLSTQLPYVELCFVAGWTKRKVLQGKRHFVQPSRLRSFIEASVNPSSSRARNETLT